MVDVPASVTTPLPVSEPVFHVNRSSTVTSAVPPTAPPLSSRFAMPVAAVAANVPPLRRSRPAPLICVARSAVIVPPVCCTAPGPANRKFPPITLFDDPSAETNKVLPSVTTRRPPAADENWARPLPDPLKPSFM
jgi:hypothetical protein